LRFFEAITILRRMNTTKKNARSHLLVATLILGMVALAGCGGGDTDTQAQGAGSESADAHAGHDHAPGEGHDHAHADQAQATGSTTLAGVSFTPPTHWSDLGADGMRQAQYRLDPVEGDSAPGEVNVFYFGPQSGGGVQANLERWIGQMTLPEGADPGTAITRSTFTASGMPGHLVSLNGTYKSGGGRPMGGDGEMLPGYRLVGVVLEGPEGSLFFKLTGPEATARAMEEDLMVMVKSATK
jgi:hypothetical protein